MLKILKFVLLLISVNIIIGCSTFGVKSNSADVYLDSARANLSQNNLSQALESANQAILAAPGNFEGYYLAAQSYQQLNDNPNAEVNYLKSFELNKNLDNLYDFGLGYANFLCFSKLDYKDADILYSQSIILAGKKQSNDIMNIYAAYGDCLSLQDRNDDAINNYIIAMGYSGAPVNAFLGISKIYLKEHNYPKAFYYINLYDGKDSVNVLKFKISALQGLLASDKNLKNYKELSEKLKNNQQQLLLLGGSDVIQSPKPEVISSPSLYVTDNLSKKIIVKEAELKPESWSNTRIKVSKNGKRYIVVEHQDTLYSIAKKCNISLDNLIKINKIHKQEIKVGDILYLQ